jgi:hypothetical protein
MPVIGLGQYFLYNDGTDKIIGIITGGDMPWDPNLQDREGIGAQHLMVGGSMAPGGNVTVIVQEKDFFTTAGLLMRASATNPSLTALIFEGGHDPLVADDGSDWRHTGCKVTQCTFSCDIDGALTANIAWVGTGEAEGSSTPVAANSNLPLEWFSGVVSFDSTAFLCQSFTSRVSTGVRPYYSLDSKADHKRMPDGLIVGSQDVELSCNVLTYAGKTRVESWMLADAPAVNIAASLVFVGTDTMTFTYSNLACTGLGKPFEPGDGTVIYPMSFRGKRNSTSTLTIA